MESAAQQQRIVVGITGASGAIYGVRTLDMLKKCGIETHLVITRSAYITLSQELSLRASDLNTRADVIHPIQSVGATISSGSFQTLGMIIAPCSVRTFSEIATGVTSTLLTRAADVVLKERRRLVLLVRETPLHLGHLQTLVRLAEIGAVIMPPVPALYTNPETIDDIVNQTVGRALDQFGIDSGIVRRWEGTMRPNLETS